MLVNLRAIHRPTDFDEAANLLQQPGVYGFYGGAASLLRQDNPEWVEAVDLADLVNGICNLNARESRIGGCTSLETIADSDQQLRTVMEAEAPLTLRYALTIGDVLMECAPHSLSLALLHGLEAQVICYGRDPITIEHWYELRPEARKQILIQGVVFSYYPLDPVRLIVKKASHPQDAATTVAAIGFARGGFRYSTKVTFFCVMCGLANHSLICSAKDLLILESLADEDQANVELRTELGKQIGQEAMLEAVKLAGEGHW